MLVETPWPWGFCGRAGRRSLRIGCGRRCCFWRRRLEFGAAFLDDEVEDGQLARGDLDLERETVREERLHHEVHGAVAVVPRELLQFRVFFVADLCVEVPAGIEQAVGATGELRGGVRVKGIADEVAQGSVFGAIAVVVTPDVGVEGAAQIAAGRLDGCDLEGGKGFAIVGNDELGVDGWGEAEKDGCTGKGAPPVARSIDESAKAAVKGEHGRGLSRA